MEEHLSRKQSLAGAILALLFLTIPTIAILLGVRQWFPVLASEHGAGIDLMINYLLITVGALFIAGHLILGYFVWRFSRQERVTFRLASPKLERRWALIPVVIMALVAEGGVLVLGLPVWAKFYAAAAPSEALTIEVTAEQFGWNVRYPGKDGLFGKWEPKLISVDNVLGLDKTDASARDDIVLLNEIRVPVNRPVHIRLRSKDTLHSFFLPNLRVKQDAVPGMTMEFWFVPTVVGRYELACAELCGFGHYGMRGLFYVTSAEEFEQWLSQQQPFF
jgi:cytochrome c oxidase subunit 2